ncbi:MAG: ribosome biogenesis GTP-binding protein YihA/YsxC [Proteobacteria bacterium]|jgi:GTP-binding protein|nr:ribosome biogenesis GTP-binding protein YihA/YsxC [Pseudomonadota bacterium]
MIKKYNFKQAKFFDTVNDLKTLPPSSIKEVAIVGRSNAGKSSLLNTLTNQNKLAFTSKTPGRTQHINYFSLEDAGVFLVDLPGYGYAKVPEAVRKHWITLLGRYLETRDPLVGLVLIMDIRHPLKELDYKMLEFFGATGKPIHIVLSKSDKLNNQEKKETLQKVKMQLSKDGFTNFTIQLFSSLKKIGVEELEIELNKWLNQEPEELIES